MADLLTRFQTLLSNGWQKMVQMVQNAAKLVMSSSAQVEKTHDEFMKVLSSAGKTATENKFAGFNLFA
jgi:hypothetical protein